MSAAVLSCAKIPSVATLSCAKFGASLSGLFLEPIFVMQPAENRRRSDDHFVSADQRLASCLRMMLSRTERTTFFSSGSSLETASN